MLESTRPAIGIVTAIVGIWQYRIIFGGMQNHAGTTPMAIRKDAGVALVRLATAIDHPSPSSRAAHRLDGGAHLARARRARIIPGKAEMLFQFRDTDPARAATASRRRSTRWSPRRTRRPLPGDASIAVALDAHR